MNTNNINENEVRALDRVVDGILSSLWDDEDERQVRLLVSLLNKLEHVVGQTALPLAE